MPTRKIPEILPIPQDNPFVRHIPLTRGKVAIVDADDFEWLNQWKWCAVYRGGWYAGRSIRESGSRRTCILMHRLILGLTDLKILGEHRDGNGLNNSRANLRPATHQQNLWNCAIRKDNRSGFKGVSWHEKSWRARITFGNRQICLGHFRDILDAANAYAEAAKRLFGEFSRLS